MNTKDIVFYGGLTIVVGTHLYMLVSVMPDDQQKAHAVVNLGAVGLILYSCYL